MKHKHIHNLIDKFLAERVRSDGSWPEVSQADMEALYRLTEAIIDAKWQRDCDGDSVINFQFINRKRYEPNHFQQVPYDHSAVTEDEMELILEKRVFNLDVASDQLRQTLNHRRIVKEQERERSGGTRAAGQVEG